MITDNYIKMCEQAEEIQKLCQYKKGDWVYFIKPKKVTLRGVDELYCREEEIEALTRENKNNELKWLPTQEQLQEMVDWKEYTISIEWNSEPYKFYWKQDPLEMYGANGDSLNEVWLMFVMHEKYHKVWTGEKWEVIK